MRQVEANLMATTLRKQFVIGFWNERIYPDSGTVDTLEDSFPQLEWKFNEGEMVSLWTVFLSFLDLYSERSKSRSCC